MPIRRKTRPGQKHQIDMRMRFRDITKAGSTLVLDVYHEEEKLGGLSIGLGSINWRGRNRRSRKRIDWTRFADMMDTLAYGE